MCTQRFPLPPNMMAWVWRKTSSFTDTALPLSQYDKGGETNGWRKKDREGEMGGLRWRNVDRNRKGCAFRGPQVKSGDANSDRLTNKMFFIKRQPKCKRMGRQLILEDRRTTRMLHIPAPWYILHLECGVTCHIRV
jgi:hypothetical protein